MHKDKSSKKVICDQTVLGPKGETRPCEHTYKLSTSITNLKNHLRVKHQIYPPDEQPSTIVTLGHSDPRQQTLPSMYHENSSLPRQKKERILYRILAWIVDDMMPFNVIENKRFCDIIYECEPRFKMPCDSTFKDRLSESVGYTTTQLRQLMDKTMVKFSFTTDLWTAIHTPYIGVTIHWLSSDFVLHQALLTIEKLPYPHDADHIEDVLRNTFEAWELQEKTFVGVTDNAASMKKAMRQLGVMHIGCTAHTIQLAVNDGVNLIKDSLVKRAKELNNFLVNRDKYRERFRDIQRSLYQRNINNSSTCQILDAIGSDTKTRWNSTFILLERLLILRNAINELQIQLSRDSDRKVRNDGETLSNLLLSENEWLGIVELVRLLEPFAKATGLISGSTYPTLSQMFPTLHCLFKHLDQLNLILTHSEIRKVHEKITQSIHTRYQDPKTTGFLATFLDPRFKSMIFATESEKIQTIAALKTKMTESTQIGVQMAHTLHESEEESPSLMSLFYDDHLPAIQSSPAEQELVVYQTLPDLPKYEPTHKKYSQYSPYTWWKNNKHTLPLLAQQVRIYLAIPASSVPAERLFSAAGNIVTDK